MVGPDAALVKPSIAQPAIALHSLALMRMVQWKNPNLKANIYLGHSLGEYTALMAAGVLGLEDGFKLLQARGLAMEECVKSVDGFAMSAVILRSPDVNFGG